MKNGAGAWNSVPVPTWAVGIQTLFHLLPTHWQGPVSEAELIGLKPELRYGVLC